MNVAIVSFGFVDVILPLLKRLQGSPVNIDLFLCFSLNNKSESVLDFKNKQICTGFIDENKSNELLGPKIANYIGNKTKIQFFIFFNKKLRSLKNFHLTKLLAARLISYDVVHFNGTDGVLPILIYWLRRKKLSFTIHDIHSHSGERSRFNFGEKLNKFILKSKYPVIVQNKNDFKLLKINYHKVRDKFHFLPFGNNEIFKEFEIKNPQPCHSDLLFFGRISLYKGIDYLISALEILKEKGILVKTIIAGNGDIYFDADKFKELGGQLIDRYIPNSELVSLIKSTKIVICPYTDATQSAVVMTAYAFNKPVIASAVGSFIEVVKDNVTGFLVKPKNSIDLAEKIQLSLNNPSLLKTMSLNIDSFLSSGEYSWDRIAEGFKEYFNSIYANE